MPRKRTYNNNNNNNAIPLLPFLLLLLFISSPATASNCTFPSGEVADEYEPCNPDQAQTSCCLRGEACLSSGLCYGALGLVYRGGCIGGWYSAACPRYCVDSMFYHHFCHHFLSTTAVCYINTHPHILYDIIYVPG